MNEISGNSNEASRGSAEIAQNIVSVSEAAKGSSEAARETSTAAVELSKFADELNSIVALFRLSESTDEDPETRPLVSPGSRGPSAKGGKLPAGPAAAGWWQTPTKKKPVA
jgi:hypothetical protein